MRLLFVVDMLIILMVAFTVYSRWGVSLFLVIPLAIVTAVVVGQRHRKKHGKSATS